MKYLTQYLTTEILKYITRPYYKLDEFIDKKNLQKSLISNPNGIELAFVLFNEFEMMEICSNLNLIKFIKQKLGKNKIMKKWDYIYSLSKNPNAKYIFKNKKELIDYEDFAENKSKWAIKLYLEYAVKHHNKIKYPENVWKNPFIFDFVKIDDNNMATYKNYTIPVDFEWLQTNPHPKALELLLKNNINFDSTFLVENTNEEALKYLNYKELKALDFNFICDLCYNPSLYNYIKTKYNKIFINWYYLSCNPAIFNKDISKTWKDLIKIENNVYKNI